jgi:hypothetical protein
MHSVAADSIEKPENERANHCAPPVDILSFFIGLIANPEIVR